MKTSIKILLASFGLILASPATAQTFTTLYSFTATSGPYPATNSDGEGPTGGLILSGNTLYGTAIGGGSSGEGTVFAVNTDGTGFTTLYGFTADNDNNGNVNVDGAQPRDGLVVSNNTLYGTATAGGSSGAGTVFAVNTDGSDFTVLYDFTRLSGVPASNSDGVQPNGLIISGDTLYGTASEGGGADRGTVFAVNTDGTSFTTLHSFTTDFDTPNNANSDGANPFAGVILSGNVLYGTAAFGGALANGTVFAVNTDGTGFTTLYSFTAGTGSYPHITNSDGANPYAGLFLSGNTLYGTARTGGNSGWGTVFAIHTNGAGFTTLYSFTNGSDGIQPNGLILSGNTLYGTTIEGGSSSNGTVFAINTDGTGFTKLHDFAATSGSYPDITNSDGVGPSSGLILSGNTLYGTANSGGSGGAGTVFSLSLPPVSAPQLTIILSGTNVVLTWPANATGFTLQSTASFVSPAAWNAVSPGPVVIDGQNTVTNPISGNQQFYQLSQ